MGKATIICGTADKNGVTQSMCSAASQYLKSVGFDSSIIYPCDLRIEHCRDCGACDHGRCVIDDDMHLIIDEVSSSDLLVLSTPIHFSGPSSVLKMVMDRFQPYWSDKESDRPSECILLMCGGSPEPRFEFTEKIVKAFCLMLGTEYLGSVSIPDTDSGMPDVKAIVDDRLAEIIKDRV